MVRQRCVSHHLPIVLAPLAVAGDKAVAWGREKGFSNRLR
jgi:hypothetical protein